MRHELKDSRGGDYCRGYDGIYPLIELLSTCMWISTLIRGGLLDPVQHIHFTFTSILFPHGATRVRTTVCETQTLVLAAPKIPDSPPTPQLSRPLLLSPYEPFEGSAHLAVFNIRINVIAAAQNHPCCSPRRVVVVWPGSSTVPTPTCTPYLSFLSRLPREALLSNPDFLAKADPITTVVLDSFVQTCISLYSIASKRHGLL